MGVKLSSLSSSLSSTSTFNQLTTCSYVPFIYVHLKVIELIRIYISENFVENPNHGVCMLGRGQGKAETGRALEMSSRGPSSCRLPDGTALGGWASHARVSRGASDGLPGRSACNRTARGRTGSSGARRGPTARACPHVSRR